MRQVMSVDETIQKFKDAVILDKDTEPTMVAALTASLDLLDGFLRDVRRIADAAEAIAAVATEE